MNFETKAIRLQTERSQHREHSTPIFPTSSFVFDNVAQMQATFAGDEEGNIYSRFTNPTVSEFEQKMAQLENTDRAIATASGMSAIVASFLSLLQAGDHVISSRAVFGSTFQFLQQSLPQYGIAVSIVDPSDLEECQKAVRPETKMFYLETPSNPGLVVFDLKKTSDFCKQNDLILNVDNCFCTPYLQNPADFGADLVTHSATKFIDGQGRVLGGAVAGREDLVDKVYQFIRRTGASLSPFNAWILSKSLETLAVRMDRHCDNAKSLAQWLEKHPHVSKVNYPFLDSHPQFDLAKAQMKQGGGIVTFELKDGLEAGKRFMDSLQMCSLTANLGDTRTIASHPSSTTHLKVPKEERELIGITEGLIRVSVGLEHIDDIIQDVEQALS